MASMDTEDMQVDGGPVPKLECTNPVEEMDSSPCEVAENILPQEISQEAGPLVQKYCKMASNISIDKASSLIKEVLEAPGLYVFGEILYMPNIRELRDHPMYSGDYRLLEVFAYGTYDEYMQNASNLPALTDSMLKKLRLLTIVSMALKDKSIKLDSLQKKLDLGSRRELEDSIIEAIYADILHGKIDQARSLFEVDWALGRDIKIDELGPISSTLEAWCNSCTSVLSNVDTVVARANKLKEMDNNQSALMHEKIQKVKTDLKKGMRETDFMEDFDEIRECEKKHSKNKKSIPGSASSSKLSRFFLSQS